MILRSLLFYIFILFTISRKVYSCGTSPNLSSQLSLTPITHGISRMNSAIMRGASLLKGDYDEFEAIDDDPIPEGEDNMFSENAKKDNIPESEVEVTTISSFKQTPINYTILKDELEMINRTKSLINLFEEKARNLYENAEKSIEINKDLLKNNCSEYNSQVLNKATTSSSEINNKTTLEKSFINGKDIKKMTEEEWEKERARQRLEEEKLIEERTREFANERMMTERRKNINTKIDNEESSGMEDTELVSTTLLPTTLLNIKTSRSTKIPKKDHNQERCNDGYVIAITNKPYSELLVPLHRAEMSSELRSLESYVKRKLISWGQYTSYPMNYKGFFSQKYVMKNPKECKGLEKFTKKAVSYGIFMEAGIFQCKCGALKTISKVH
uniref:SUN domain-containing protein n=1 Tax=Strongyloides venezuelensis TaxID=75913 RepID=A0A0K0FMU7_STRVS